MGLGVVPAHWKEATIIPLTKVTNPQAAKDYRPISLLSVLGKVLESVVNARLSYHLEAESLLSPTQFGFRRKRTAEQLLLQVVQRAHSHWNSGMHSLFFSFDVRKAFDTVWHGPHIQAPQEHERSWQNAILDYGLSAGPKSKSEV